MPRFLFMDHSTPTWKHCTPDTARDFSAIGYYVVSYDFLNLRAKASESAKKLGTLQGGELILVEEIVGGWGRVEMNGTVAYVSLQYADFVTPTTYVVRYVSEGETLLEKSRYSTQRALVASLRPEREGYVFLHWVTEAGETFAASDVLPLGNLTLTAVFEALPPTLTPEEDAPPTDAGQPPVASPPTEAEPPLYLAPERFESEVIPGTQPTDTAAAAQHAGVVSAVLALSLVFSYGTRIQRDTEGLV
jgi:hypothetical protein